MLSTTVVHRCPHCRSERLYKNGHTVRGAQRAKCKDCGRTFTLAPKWPRHSPMLKAQVLAAHEDRMSLRGIHRTFGVCYQTVMKWFGKKSKVCPLSWTRCCPAKRATYSSWMNSGALWAARLVNFGCEWRFAAEPAKSPLGRLATEDCKVPATYGLRCLRITDGALPAVTSGNPTPRRSQRIPIVAVAKRKEKPTTWSVGLAPCRARISRLVRKAYSFSKNAENHLDAVHLFIIGYNLRIKHAPPN